MQPNWHNPEELVLTFPEGFRFITKDEVVNPPKNVWRVDRENEHRLVGNRVRGGGLFFGVLIVKSGTYITDDPLPKIAKVAQVMPEIELCTVPDGEEI